MITRELKNYQLSRITSTHDGYGQQVSTPGTIKEIAVAIYFDSQISTKNPQYIEATHVGLTKEKEIKINDIIDVYQVLQVNPIGRYNQLILKQV